MTDAAVAGPQVIIGLGIAIFVMIYLVLKTRVHALLALIIAASPRLIHEADLKTKMASGFLL